MLKNKIVKYIHSIVHNVLFKDVCDDPFFAVNTKKNIYNIIRNNNNIDVEHLYRIDLFSIFRYELSYYISIKTKENSFVETIFKDFIDFYKKCAVLNNILNCLYFVCDIDNIYLFYPNNVFLQQWKLFVLEPNIAVIKNYISEKVNNIEPQENETESVNNIMYSLFSKYDDLAKDVINFVKYNRNLYLESLVLKTDDLGVFIDVYKNEILTQEKLNKRYEDRFKFVSDDVIRIFFTKDDKITYLLDRCLTNNDNSSLIKADVYLFNYFDRDIYNQFLKKFINRLMIDVKKGCSDDIENYVQVNNKISQVFYKDTFELCEKIIDVLFVHLKDSDQIEKKILDKIVLDGFRKASGYSKLIKYCDEEIFVSGYAMCLCKRIVNKTIDYDSEKKYIFSVQKYLKDYFYRIKIMLDEYLESTFFSRQFVSTDIVVGRHHIWPVRISEKNIPKSFVNELNGIKKVYSEQKHYSNRKLYLCDSLLRCDIDFNGYTFNIKGKYVDILLLFNKKDKVLKKNIHEDISKFVRIKLIKEDSTHYIINDNFSYKKKKIKIN